MATSAPEKLIREYRVEHPTRLTPGLGDSDDVDVTRFDGETPIKLVAVGKPSGSFVISRSAWQRLGEPSTVRVTLEPVE